MFGSWSMIMGLAILVIALIYERKTERRNEMKR